jgi:DNA-binding NarL/FixJ family response regulator
MGLSVIKGKAGPVADGHAEAADGHSRDLHVQAAILEQRAAELRSKADRLCQRAVRLRAEARRASARTRPTTRRDQDSDGRLGGYAPVAVLPRLTARQQQIVALIVRGRTNRRIAQDLVITPGTAANHVAQLLDRLGLDNRVQLAAWAVEHPECWHDPPEDVVLLGQA